MRGDSATSYQAGRPCKPHCYMIYFSQFILDCLLTRASQRAVGGLRVGELQAPDQALQAPRRQAVLAAVQRAQPALVLAVQVVLHKALVQVADAAWRGPQTL